MSREALKQKLSSIDLFESVLNGKRPVEIAAEMNTTAARIQAIMSKARAEMTRRSKIYTPRELGRHGMHSIKEARADRLRWEMLIKEARERLTKEIEEYSDVLTRETVIERLGLSERATKSLRSEGIRTIENIVSLTDEELFLATGITETAMAEVKRKLEKFGFQLARDKMLTSLSYRGALKEAILLLRHPERYTEEQKQKLITIFEHSIHNKGAKLPLSL